MSRLTNALLGNQAYAVGATHPMLDMTYGGQFGWSPDYSQWVSNQAYVRKNLICILLEAPKFFTLMPNSPVWFQTLKSMVELMPISIEGMNGTIEVEFDQHNVGGAGEVQHEVTNATRTRSDPTFTYIEKYGLPIQTFLSAWIQYGMMDPETKTALITTLGGQAPADLLADWFTMSCLFMEPDPSGTKVVKSWVSTNMMPHGTGEMISKRDLNSASELLTLSINFTALSQFSLGTDIFAQKILTAINQTNANPMLRPSFIQGIDPNVPNPTASAAVGASASVAGATPQGYIEGEQSLGASAVGTTL